MRLSVDEQMPKSKGFLVLSRSGVRDIQYFEEEDVDVGELVASFYISDFSALLTRLLNTRWLLYNQD